jgi:hypothetical protein
LIPKTRPTDKLICLLRGESTTPNAIPENLAREPNDED